MRCAKYIVVKDDYLQKEPLVLRDVGPWDAHPTLTNGIEEVVNSLIEKGALPGGRRLLYYDSEGQLTEALIENGKFSAYGLVRNEEGDTY